MRSPSCIDDVMDLVHAIGAEGVEFGLYQVPRRVPVRRDERRQRIGQSSSYMRGLVDKRLDAVDELPNGFGISVRVALRVRLAVFGIGGIADAHCPQVVCGVIEYLTHIPGRGLDGLRIWQR